MTFEANIVCDSISPDGVRLTTMSLKYPRFIHAEFMTHRMFSRNASSSRAIPAKKIIQQIIDDPAMPVHWGSNQPGMQAGEELWGYDGYEYFRAQDLWLEARDNAVKTANQLIILGLHKQVVNRILEPWHHIHVVVTATDWANFFNLRCHPDAQPEMKTLAEHMRDVYYESRPSPTNFSEWHLPYIQKNEWSEYSLVDLIKISVARCARVSYMNHDGTNPDPVKDIALHDRLMESGHMSPSEHQGRPALTPTEYWGNFRGWVQYRKTLTNENRDRYDPCRETNS